MRLSSGHRGWVYWGAAILFVSGALWLICHYFLQVEGEFGPTNNPLEPWALRVHGGAAMLALVLIGSLLPVHVRRAWHQRHNLAPGIALLAVMLLLTLSGYALYYFGDEETRPIVSLLHWAVGLAAPPLLLWHVVSGRAETARARHAARVATRAATRGAPDSRAG
jgi:hypothetical protein